MDHCASENVEDGEEPSMGVRGGVEGAGVGAVEGRIVRIVDGDGGIGEDKANVSTRRIGGGIAVRSGQLDIDVEESIFKIYGGEIELNMLQRRLQLNVW